MSKQRYRIIWPVTRDVTEQEIRSQYADAVANDNCADIGSSDTVDLLEIMQELDSSGEVTFSRQAYDAATPAPSDAQIDKMLGIS
jgi:hypothetical protein